jgi:protein-tyrosine phosphatase
MKRFSMIDLHTHILPDWDDGAADWEETSQMLIAARADGIRGIALTPHIHRLAKYGEDWKILAERKTEFFRRHGTDAIDFYFGAEVHIHPEMVRTIKDNGLTLNGSRYIFIEFPAEHVLSNARDLIFAMTLEGLIPIISHPERNIVFMKRPDRLFELISMGALGQLTAQSLTGAFGSKIQKTAELFLKQNLAQIIASDAHDAKRRLPRLSEGIDKAVKIIGRDKAWAMVTTVPEAILRNEEIPDLGRPQKNKNW